MKQYFNLYFTTCTILNWYPLLRNDSFKDILIDSFRFCVREGRTSIWAFVIMDNHFHIIWQINPDFSLGKVRQSLLKFTAQQFKYKLIDNNDSNTLKRFLVSKGDRKYQFWIRNPLSVEILNDDTLNQKLNYVHKNPIKKWNIEEYKYSSWPYYRDGIKNWDFLN